MNKLIAGVLTILVMASPLALATPASATTPRVKIGLSASRVAAGGTVAVRVAVRRGGPLQPVVLQRKQGGSWVRVAKARLPRKGLVKRVVFSQRLAAPGSYTYRAKLAAKGRFSSAKSLSVTVRAVAVTPLRFNLAGAKGLAVRQSTASGARFAESGTAATQSNLSVVTATGAVRDAAESGGARIASLFITPTGKVYVVFTSRVNLADTSLSTGSGCLLAEVDPASGVPTCIDSSLMSIGWGSGEREPAVQVDDSGAVYYTGSTSSGSTVLRRYRDGVWTDLINDNLSLTQFVVLGDGSVIATGWVPATGTAWTRRITPQGGLQTLFNDRFWGLAKFPDSNVYFSTGDSSYNIRRFLTDSMQVDSTAWLTQSSMYGASQFPCPANYQCTPNIARRAQTSDGMVFVRDWYSANGTSKMHLLKLFPGVEAAPLTTVDDVVLMRGVGTRVLIAGHDAAGANVLSAYDPVTKAETPVLGPDREVEIYHLNAISSTVAMFDGLRFADNQLVVGTVDVTTGQVSFVNTLPSKWADFQTFVS